MCIYMLFYVCYMCIYIYMTMYDLSTSEKATRKNRKLERNKNSECRDPQSFWCRYTNGIYTSSPNETVFCPAKLMFDLVRYLSWYFPLVSGYWSVSVVTWPEVSQCPMVRPVVCDLWSLASG